MTHSDLRHKQSATEKLDLLKREVLSKGVPEEDLETGRAISRSKGRSDSEIGKNPYPGIFASIWSCLL